MVVLPSSELEPRGRPMGWYFICTLRFIPEKWPYLNEDNKLFKKYIIYSLLLLLLFFVIRWTDQTWKWQSGLAAILWLLRIQNGELSSEILQFYLLIFKKPVMT